MKQKFLPLIALLLAAALCVAGYLYGRRFSTHKWKTAPEHRTRIVDDFLRRYELEGMPKDVVIALLGQDDSDTGYFSAQDRFVYCLGRERGLISIDNEWLLIDFADGTVTAYCLITD